MKGWVSTAKDIIGSPTAIYMPPHGYSTTYVHLAGEYEARLDRLTGYVQTGTLSARP
jgi:hypothetical protein